MQDSAQAPAGAGAGARAPASERVRLARAVLGGALAVEGVAAGHPGPSGSGVISGGDEPLVGVSAASLPDGRYEVSLHLVATPVPLHALAERVRERVVEEAAREGLGERLGPVNVSFEDMVEIA